MAYYLQGFFAFKGRMARIPYFCFSFTVFITVFVLSFLWTLYTLSGPLLLLETAAVAVVCIGASWANLAITTKRLHDLGLSGWHMTWLFLPTVIPMIVADFGITVLCWLTSFALSMWLLFMPASKSERYA